MSSNEILRKVVDLRENNRNFWDLGEININVCAQTCIR